jgi:hypothetical protein
LILEKFWFLGECECKDHVEGDSCDLCREGFFNLDANNPQGCTACFCFGVTDTCESVGWNMSKVSTLDEWILTDSTGSRILYPSYLNGTPVVAADDTYEMDVFYWLAPKSFRGNRLTSYGGKLDYSITFIKGWNFMRTSVCFNFFLVRNFWNSIMSESQILP